jgi:hypothetical protein
VKGDFMIKEALFPQPWIEDTKDFTQKRFNIANKEK